MSNVTLFTAVIAGKTAERVGAGEDSRGHHHAHWHLSIKEGGLNTGFLPDVSTTPVTNSPTAVIPKVVVLTVTELGTAQQAASTGTLISTFTTVSTLFTVPFRSSVQSCVMGTSELN
ncbi:hypothetical protein BT96DRAFT_1065287, partial [Gymnopus androsaceus JB14]|uniref:Uncharacterized protein n=1 Tax=Gymnopus androsaceus JB14 TaxID=1447944 RepID=A0A6A4GC35_9AGAR